VPKESYIAMKSFKSFETLNKKMVSKDNIIVAWTNLGVAEIDDEGYWILFDLLSIDIQPIWGASEEDALANAKDFLGEFFEECLARGDKMTKKGPICKTV